MSAEDYIDWSDYCDDEYWMQFQPVYHPAHIRPTQQYTDRFTFNKRRLRTDRQKLVLEGATMFKKEVLAANKFYIGSNSVFSRGIKGWGHPTEAEAVEHAERMLTENREVGEVFIVEIIKVVRRKPIDVDIEEV